ncbi:MAG: DUF393 domain-containing protein [Pirellulales bacterium]|nr:DUF393 domain-containing protein [Pirellulales bacterium]
MILFDGECAVCRSGVEMLRRIDGGREFEYVSLHDQRARDLLPDRSHEDLMREMHLVESDGRWYAGAEAVRAISRRVPVLWGVAVCLHVPGTLPVWNRLYRAIARRRYRISARLGCESGACTLHV